MEFGLQDGLYKKIVLAQLWAWHIIEMSRPPGRIYPCLWGNLDHLCFHSLEQGKSISLI